MHLLRHAALASAANRKDLDDLVPLARAAREVWILAHRLPARRRLPIRPLGRQRHDAALARPRHDGAAAGVRLAALIRWHCAAEPLVGGPKVCPEPSLQLLFLLFAVSRFACTLKRLCRNRDLKLSHVALQQGAG
jgi:hypothetical protein